MTSQNHFNRKELLEYIHQKMGDSEFGLEHINGDLYIFLNSILVEDVLLTQELDIYVPYEDVFFGKKINKKSYLREKIVFEQYIELYHEKEENFSTMKVNSSSAESIEEAFQGMKDFCNKIQLLLSEIPSYYSGDVKYTYQDRRYKEEFLKRSAFQPQPSEPKIAESPENLGYFVEGITLVADQLRDKDELKCVKLEDELLDVLKSFREFAQNS